MYINNLSAFQLTTISTVSVLSAYALVFLWNWFQLSVDYFLLVQITFGVLIGVSSGVGYSTVNIVTQQWLNKKRASLNPYLMIGSPLVALFAAPAFPALCKLYTWSGSVLIIIGLLLNCFVVILLYAERPGHVKPNENPTLVSVIRSPDLWSSPLFKCVLAFNLCQTGAILIPYFTQTVNVATEYGLKSYQIGLLMSSGTLTELICRPLVSRFSDKISITRLATLWSAVFFIQTAVGSFATTPEMFYVMGSLLGVGMAGGAGMKMVLIMECLGKHNLRSYIGKFEM